MLESDLEQIINRDLPGAEAGRRIQDLFDTDYAPWIAQVDTLDEARRLEAAFEAQRESTDPTERLDATAAYIQTLRETLLDHMPRSVASDRMADAKRVKVDLGRLVSAKAEYEARETDWDAMSKTFHGRVAVFVGTARAPQER